MSFGTLIDEDTSFALLDRFVEKDIREPCPRSPNFAMTGKHWSRLQFKLLNHHLEPFGV